MCSFYACTCWMWEKQKQINGKREMTLKLTNEQLVALRTAIDNKAENSVMDLMLILFVIIEKAFDRLKNEY